MNNECTFSWRDIKYDSFDSHVNWFIRLQKITITNYHSYNIPPLLAAGAVLSQPYVDDLQAYVET